ncbi:hypothetical protein [Alteraurantiacibacter aquimixticola]|uniref:Uncharacterized protein n=1 Tax=Alteraurantiacibacter aquimixticola TaxID=2489173 RepID=A0A4T3EZ22_9SPHN|nr:hypothetical protein [Alteraurantiacibacter aquimixticola]TIX49992.1 hypothetical protein E5222_06730 [Alteraurantiacibacter aquimixticola]
MALVCLSILGASGPLRAQDSNEAWPATIQAICSPEDDPSPFDPYTFALSYTSQGWSARIDPQRDDAVTVPSAYWPSLDVSFIEVPGRNEIAFSILDSQQFEGGRLDILSNPQIVDGRAPSTLRLKLSFRDNDGPEGPRWQFWANCVFDHSGSGYQEISQ